MLQIDIFMPSIKSHTNVLVVAAVPATFCFGGYESEVLTFASSVLSTFGRMNCVTHFDKCTI